MSALVPQESHRTERIRTTVLRGALPKLCQFQGSSVAQRPTDWTPSSASASSEVAGEAATLGRPRLQRDSVVDPVIPLYLGDVPWGTIGYASPNRMRNGCTCPRLALRERDDGRIRR
jgi:hypothetical protein